MPVNALAILTCDRPESLSRTIEGLVFNLRRHERRPAITVFDDSATTAGQVSSRAVVDRWSRTYGQVHYVGLEERRALVEALVDRDVPRTVIEFGLLGRRGCGPTTGANRNSALLWHLDDRFVVVDDDLEYRACRSPEYAEGTVFDTERDPCEYYFYPDRATLLAAVQPTEHFDLLGLHEELLGDAGVSVTLTGLAGDCAWMTPRGLWMSGRSRDRLFASEESYDLSMRSREVLRVAKQKTVSAGRSCIAPCVGLDQRRLLPPFPPIGRNSDGTFGALVRACDFGTIGHIPVAIVHSPAERRALTPDALWTGAASYDLSDVMRALIRNMPASGNASAVDRLTLLGDRLRDLCGRDLAEFEQGLADIMSAHTAGHLAAMDATEAPEAPSYWRRDRERLRQALRSRAETAGAVIPRECAAHPQPRAFVREVLTNIAELMSRWRAIASAATELQRAGRLAQLTSH